jgi:hypothetical protein
MGKTIKDKLSKPVKTINEVLGEKLGYLKVPKINLEKYSLKKRSVTHYGNTI